MDKDKTVDLARAPIPEGLLCKKCKSARFRTEPQTFKDGSQHVRIVCSKCGKFSQYAKQRDAPEPKYEPVPADAHAKERAAPPSSWEWIGLVRLDDGVWRAVAKAASLEGCWDVLLHFPARGDLLCIPTRPTERLGEG